MAFEPDNYPATLSPETELPLLAAEILERMTDAFLVLDHEFRIVYANREACRINRKPLADFRGRTHWEEWPSSLGSELERQYRRALDEQVDAHFEHHYLDPAYDVWVEIDAYPNAQGLSIFYRDISARKQAEETLRRSREDLRLAIDAAQLGTFYCDWPLDKIIWNDICKEHFFLPHDADVDMALFYSLLHPDDRELTRHAIERALAAREVYNVEYRALAPDGRTRWVNAVGRFYYQSDGSPYRFDGITIDISARKRAEQEMRARAERESLLNQIGQEMRATIDPDSIQQAAVRALGEALGADRCYFSQYDLAADSTWIGQDYRRGDLPSLAGRYRFSDFQVDPAEFFPDERPFIVTDALDATWAFPAPLLTAIRRLRVRSAVGVPIFDAGRLVATLNVAMADAPRPWTADDVMLVQAVAAQTRSAVEAGRLLAAQKDLLEAEALVGRIGVAIRSTLDPDVIQETAAALLGEALGVDRCYFSTFDLVHGVIETAPDWRRADLPSVSGRYRTSQFTNFLDEIYGSGGTAVVEDIHVGRLSPAAITSLNDNRFRALIAVPLYDSGQLVAALVLGMADAPRAWTAPEIALAEQVATLTRSALEAARVSRKEHTIAQQLQAALQPPYRRPCRGWSWPTIIGPRWMRLGSAATLATYSPPIRASRSSWSATCPARAWRRPRKSR